VETNQPQSKLRQQYHKANERFHVADLPKVVKEIHGIEARLLTLYSKALQEDDPYVLEGVLSNLAGLNSFFGFTGNAEKYIREREERFPDSNEAKLAAANFLYVHRFDHSGALKKLSLIEQPSRPFEVGAVDTYYNALCLKGILLAHLRRRQQCETHMRKLADFTLTNINETIFFFDLKFVKFMIDSRLALQDCQRYLQALSTRKQVKHDGDETKQLLEQVNELLSGQSTRKNSRRKPSKP
jgi:hypothetical protein